MKGKVVDITEVPDPVFAQKMMGDGFAIIPEEGTLVSPVAGEIIQVFPTKHAFGIKSGDIELLIHVGLETVAMKGEGFDVKVSAGDKIEVGQTLLTYDLEVFDPEQYIYGLFYKEKSEEEKNNEEVNNEE